MNYGSLSQEEKKAGGRLGFIFSQQLDEINTLQLDLLYEEKGSAWGSPFYSIGYDGDYAFYNLTYLSTSLYFKMKSRIDTLLKDFDFMIGGAWPHNLYARQKWVIEDAINGFETGPDDIRA